MNLGNDDGIGLGEIGDGGSNAGRGISRRTIMKGAAWTVPALMVTTAAPAFAVSCGPSTLFDVQARGILLSGGILGTNLDNVAQLSGAHAFRAAPATGTDTSQNVSDLTVLNTIGIPVGGVGAVLSDILAFAAPVGTGALNEYAFVDATGAQRGASGFIDSNGTIDFDGNPDGSWPDFATLDLRTILTSSALNSIAGPGTAIGNLLDGTIGVDALQLQIGALAGRAADALNCNPGDVVGQLTREYLIAHLRLLLDPANNTLVSNLLTAIGGLKAGLEANISTDDIFNALPSLLRAAINVLKTVTGTLYSTVSVTVDTSYLTAQPYPRDPNAAVRLDLANSKLIIDLASATGIAYATEGTGAKHLVNTVAPNTVLFVNKSLGDEVDTVTTLLDGWINALADSLLDLVTVNIELGIDPLVGSNFAILQISGTINDLLAGTGTVTLLGGLGLPVGVTVGAIAQAVGTLIKSSLNSLLLPGGTLHNALDALQPVLKSVFTVLYDVVQIRLNAQNYPNDNNAPATPGGFAPSARIATPPLPARRWDVAALNVYIASFLDVLDIYLARGSVGPYAQR